MNFTIHFTTSTRRLLDQRWHTALKQKQLQLVKRITALQWLADGQGPKGIAARLEVATSTVYAWLSAFLHQGEKALEYGPKKGRPARLSQPQLDQLKARLLAGPTECTYTTGLWNAALVAQLIETEFGQTFHPRYVAALLGKLGFSYQKARFSFRE